MADFRLMCPSNGEIKSLQSWTQVSPLKWRIERSAIFCEDRGAAGLPQMGEVLRDPSPSSGGSTLTYGKKLVRSRTVKRATLRKVVTSLKRSGSLHLGSKALGINIGTDESYDDDESDSSESLDAVTTEYTEEIKFEFSPGDQSYMVAQYRLREIGLYLDFEDFLEFHYVKRGPGLIHRRERHPSGGPGSPWPLASPNIVQRGRVPLGTVSYWEPLEPRAVAKTDYVCEVPRPFEVVWSPTSSPARSIYDVAIDADERSLYDLVDYKLWKPRRPPA